MRKKRSGFCGSANSKSPSSMIGQVSAAAPNGRTSRLVCDAAEPPQDEAPVCGLEKLRLVKTGSADMHGARTRGGEGRAIMMLELELELVAGALCKRIRVTLHHQRWAPGTSYDASPKYSMPEHTLLST